MAASRSAAPQGQGPRSDVQQQVVEWRELVLIQAGCSQEVAERIAEVTNGAVTPNDFVGLSEETGA